MVKVGLGAAAALALLLTQPAFAADYSPKPRPDFVPRPRVDFVPAPANTWTGLYAGLNGGWANASRSAVALTPSSAASSAFYGAAIAAGDMPLEYDTDASGFIGGGQAGFNWQLGGIVVGLEGDIGWSDIGKSVAASTSFGTTRVDTDARIGLDWFGSLRLRGGYASDNAMLYVTGGLAVGGVSSSYSATFTELGNSVAGSEDNTAWGWTLGAGAEVRIFRNVSVKAELLYFDLGKSHYVAFGAAGAAGNNIDVDTELHGWLGRLGFNFLL